MSHRAPQRQCVQRRAHRECHSVGLSRSARSLLGRHRQILLSCVSACLQALRVERRQSLLKNRPSHFRRLLLIPASEPDPSLEARAARPVFGEIPHPTPGVLYAMTTPVVAAGDLVLFGHLAHVGCAEASSRPRRDLLESSGSPLHPQARLGRVPSAPARPLRTSSPTRSLPNQDPILARGPKLRRVNRESGSRQADSLRVERGEVSKSTSSCVGRSGTRSSQTGRQSRETAMKRRGHAPASSRARTVPDSVRPAFEASRRGATALDLCPSLVSGILAREGSSSYSGFAALQQLPAPFLRQQRRRLHAHLPQLAPSPRQSVRTGLQLATAYSLDDQQPLCAPSSADVDQSLDHVGAASGSRSNLIALMRPLRAARYNGVDFIKLEAEVFA